MNLLLLLSALLSALTGAVPGVRRADVPQAVARQAACVAAVAVAAPAIVRHPVSGPARLIAVLHAPMLPAVRVSVVPIWFDRRRE